MFDDLELYIDRSMMSSCLWSIILPSGSTCLAYLIASDVEKSTLAAVIASMIALGFDI